MNNQLQIELKEDVAQGIYANLAVITHSSSEFIVDFVRVMPGMPKAGVKSRIVLAPEHAKRLLRALEENIGKYERTFGTIRLLDEQPIPPMTNVKGGPKIKKKTCSALIIQILLLFLQPKVYSCKLI